MGERDKLKGEVLWVGIPAFAGMTVREVEE